MTCPICGAFGNPDPSTGYDGEELCPACRDEGFEALACGCIEDPNGYIALVDRCDKHDTSFFDPDDAADEAYDRMER